MTTKTPSDEQHIAFEDMDAFLVLCGERDENLKRLEQRTGVALRVRGNEVTLRGTPADAVLRAADLLRQLYVVARQNRALTAADVDRGAAVLAADPEASLVEVLAQGVVLPATGARVLARSPNQKRYLAAMQRHDLVFGIGPAGTGKTYLAMATAVSALLSKQVMHIVLTRPAVEAGERLGFLPGDLVEKVNPYLRPLYDALYDLLDADRGKRLLEKGQIEIAPLAFMRGRTLSNAFVILDEAQNCTVEQMKMFLTRLGYHSKAVVTGDVTQTDLPPDRPSGLEHARRILDGTPGIGFVEFDEGDVMRHPLVAGILRAYERDRKTQSTTGTPEP
jgi:phosphate starvation-inducible protein PhoH and related proteins